jgi:hypothetical protein
MLRSISGVRSLSALAAEASSARVLDLASLAAEKPTDEDYVDKPMFLHQVLNRAILVKHNGSLVDSDPFAPRRLGATKVIFPFDVFDLNLGGQYLFVDQADFLSLINRHLDYDDSEQLDRDVAVLRMLDKLPTLDPFLVRGILAHQQIDVGRCYYRLSELDRADMMAFVVGEMQALIKLCFKGEATGGDGPAKRLSLRLLGDATSPELDLLRQALRMETSEFSEAMFTWKAFLYYRWRAQELQPQVKATVRAFSGIRSRRFERDEVLFVNRCKDVTQRSVAYMTDQVTRHLRRYDQAFHALTSSGDPSSFRVFLAKGAGLELGEQIGALEMLVGFWETRFGGGRINAMSPCEMLDGMRDLVQGLAVSPQARSESQGEGETQPPPLREAAA